MHMPNLFILRETSPGETRVAATPETIRSFIKAGVTVSIESGAGSASFIADDEYRDAGALFAPRAEGLAAADIVASVAPPLPADVEHMKSGAIVIALLAPHSNVPLVRALMVRIQACRITVIWVLIVSGPPRISRLSRGS